MLLRDLLFIDFETQDPYLSCKMGAGWTYALKDRPNKLGFSVLGMAYHHKDTGNTGYLTDELDIRRLLAKCTTLVAHNASYDLGCLEVLEIKTTEFKVLDTKIMAHLHNSALESYSLDNLAKRYTNHEKKTQILSDAVWRNDLYPYTKKELRDKEKGIERERKPEDKLLKWAYENMSTLQAADRDAVASYAIADIEATVKLFEYLKSHMDADEAYEKYYRLPQIVNSYRIRGIKFDTTKARLNHADMMGRIASAYKTLYNISGEEFNISSPKEVPKIFDKAGIPYPRTGKGNPSITTPWMEQQKHRLCKAIVETRQLLKIDRDFIQKIIEMQDIIGDDHRVFPELNILQARTGRFSSSNPNLQQIPSSGDLGAMCRELYCPEPGERIYSLDYSNQEGRLQVHYASLLGCEGADALKCEFIEMPDLDMHQMIAEMVGIDRKQAKAINLGISYGMGKSKLADQLGVSEAQAKILIEKYHVHMPFLNQLNEKCKKALKSRGWIKTIGGRKLRLDPPMYINGEKRTFEYKALNKLIQGSAADQIIAAMVKCYDEGIKVLMPIHDQLLISGTKEDAIRTKEIMETILPLEVPVVVDVDLRGGENWQGAGH